MYNVCVWIVRNQVDAIRYDTLFNNIMLMIHTRYIQSEKKINKTKPQMVFYQFLCFKMVWRFRRTFLTIGIIYY